MYHEIKKRLKSKKKPRKFFRFMRKLNRQSQRDLERQITGVNIQSTKGRIQHTILIP